MPQVGNVDLSQLAVAGTHNGEGLGDLLKFALPIAQHVLSQYGGGIHRGKGFLDILKAAAPLLQTALPLLMGAGLHHQHPELMEVHKLYHAYGGSLTGGLMPVADGIGSFFGFGAKKRRGKGLHM